VSASNSKLVPLMQIAKFNMKDLLAGAQTMQVLCNMNMIQLIYIL